MSAPLEPAADSAPAPAAREQQFKIAFDHAPTAMAIMSLAPDSAGHYVRVNLAFCAMLGHTPERLVGASILDITHPEDRERDWATFQRIVRGEADGAVLDKRFVHANGETVFASVACRPAPNGQAEPVYLLIHAIDITQRRQEQAALERISLTDNLTGLANRTLLNDRLAQALARLHREESYAALLLLDIDRFAFVNETLGHAVGDALLVEVASRIEAVTRADATVARVDGDEFVVLVEGLAGPAEVHRIGVRLLGVLRKPFVLVAAPEPVAVTVSIGIAIASTAERSPDEVFREADLALYRAKDAGRDQYALFDDELRARVVARMDTESLLRRAIADDLLVAYYQPVIDLEDGRIVGVETLARIADPARGLVHPGAFIDVAEDTGLITDVDVRMFELAVGQLARWSSAGEKRLGRLSVNVSARSLDDAAFVDRIASVLTWYDVPGDLVRVELSEPSLLATSDTVRASLARLNALGLHLGIDDFGTGYSALAYLQRFELRFLKIDRSFVSRLGEGPRNDAVVAAVINLAHAHELLVVAEGIETPEQLAALRDMGCDRGQGFLIGRPLDLSALETLVADDPRW